MSRLRRLGWSVLRGWVLLALLLWLMGCLGLGAAIALAPSESGAIYEQQVPSVDGIGKVYLGREIAQVMGYQGAGWLERSSRLREERPDVLIAALDLDKTMTVADIGAGTGYLSFQIAPQVKRVYAVDVQPEMVEILQLRCQEQEIEVVKPVLGQPDDPQLPPEGVDLALMVDVYHELEFPYEMMRSLRQALKPEGKVVLAEYRGENPFILIKRLHKMSQRQVKREMAAAGFVWLKTDERLPQQHLLFFTPDREMEGPGLADKM